MTVRKPSVRRIVMAKGLAHRWLMANIVTEYRVTIHYIGKDGKHIPGLLRSFRDGKLRVGSISAIPDLGISESFDSVTIWSQDHASLLKLASWFDEHGYETSGVW